MGEKNLSIYFLSEVLSLIPEVIVKISTLLCEYMKYRVRSMVVISHDKKIQLIFTGTVIEKMGIENENGNDITFKICVW